jgi:hypothetical protein
MLYRVSFAHVEQSGLANVRNTKSGRCRWSPACLGSTAGSCRSLRVGWDRPGGALRVAAGPLDDLREEFAAG